MGVRAEAMPQLATLVDADGHVLAEAFPRVYNAVAAEAQKVGDCGSGGVLRTYSIFALFSQERVRSDVLKTTWCANGHELTPDKPGARRARHPLALSAVRS